ncbi:MAG: DUF4442 domain-containing protein [Flavobacteriaceae bacterium]
MKFTLRKLNIFLLTKLPSAYFSGVRLSSISDNEVIVKVKHRWINQNPFKSLYWATQGMASELTTGILVMKEIDACGKRISMLVTQQKGTFTKKARGKILFSCKDGSKIKDAVAKTIRTGEGQTITMISSGIDEQGDVVSTFEYEWSVKAKD